MSKKEQEQVKEEELQQEETQTEAQNAEVESQNAEEEQPAKEETPEDKIAALQAELIKNGGEKAMLGLLPVIDDFERAIDAIDKSSDVEGLKEGVDLIYNKFMKYLESQQVKPMESTGTDFDADIYEAVTTFPAPDESMKGKVIDTVQKGYTINEKVLRHAKVVVGQ